MNPEKPDPLRPEVPLTLGQAADMLNVSPEWLAGKLAAGEPLVSRQGLAAFGARLDAERDGAIAELAELTQTIDEDKESRDAGPAS